jgi:twitching motility protein PilT
MARIDVYLRSIERFGAAGALLTSGQSVTMRFPTGDRHATQVTPHDQLVMMVREIAPPVALDQIDKQRGASFEFDSGTIRYAITVAPKPGAWQVGIEPVTAAAVPPPPPVAPRAATAAPVPEAQDMAIERGPYEAAATTRGGEASGSNLLDELIAAARAARASDVVVGAGAAPFLRVGGEVVALPDRGAVDGDLLGREVGVVAPAEARGAWAEHGTASFVYGGVEGRQRVRLTRDRRGPGLSIRLLVGEPLPLDRLGVPPDVLPLLDGRGLLLIAGPPGAGKTTTLASLVRELGGRRRRVVTLEAPIEILQADAHGWVSQREVGADVASFAIGVRAAADEGVDAIAIGVIDDAATAAAAIEAAASGHLVLATITAATTRGAVERLVELVPGEHRDGARATAASTLLAVLGQSQGRRSDGSRGVAFELLGGAGRGGRA